MEQVGPVEQSFTCPYCWEKITMVIEPISEVQEYVEDCEVCCNPILLRFSLDESGGVSFSAEVPG